MRTVIALLMSKPFKWGYALIFILAMPFYCLMTLIECAGPDMKIAYWIILARVIDLAGVLGFCLRRGIFHRYFWQAWFVWSVVWFFWQGLGRDAFAVGFPPPILLLRLFYNATLIAMLYVYAFLDDSAWTGRQGISQGQGASA